MPADRSAISRKAARERWALERADTLASTTLQAAWNQGFDAALAIVLLAAEWEDAGEQHWKALVKATREQAPNVAVVNGWSELSPAAKRVYELAARATVERAVRRVKWASGDLRGAVKP